MWLLFQDAWRTQSSWDKIKLWFMPTGWRPADVEQSHPIEVVKDVYTMEKYHVTCSRMFLFWSWFQLLVNMLLMYFLLVSIADLPFIQILTYAIFLFISIFSYTSLMDRNQMALAVESIKFLMGFFIIYYWQTWFLLDQWLPSGTLMVCVYLVLSALMSFYFLLFENKNPLLNN